MSGERERRNLLSPVTVYETEACAVRLSHFSMHPSRTCRTHDGLEWCRSRVMLVRSRSRSPGPKAGPFAALAVPLFVPSCCEVSAGIIDMDTYIHLRLGISGGSVQLSATFGSVSSKSSAADYDSWDATIHNISKFISLRSQEDIHTESMR